MDWSLLHSLNDFLFRHDAVEDPLSFYINVSEALFIGMLAIVCLFGQASWRRAAVAAGLSAALGLAAGKLISGLVDRARPFVADPSGVHLFSHHAADPGFPSDHATAAFAIATAILLRNRRWGSVALAAATVLSIGRVAIGVHFPSDVLAGAALGAAAALVLWAPPLRAKVEALADYAGAQWDRLLGWSAGRVGLSWRS